jgi:hypothetical protein
MEAGSVSLRRITHEIAEHLHIAARMPAMPIAEVETWAVQAT